MPGKQRVSEALWYKKFGNPLDVLHLEEQTIDGPKKGEVLIKMLASPVHPSDVYMLTGDDVNRPSLPAIGGSEGVGVVIECGSGVTGLEVGDRVFIVGPWQGGFWQTHMCQSVQDVIKVDKRLPIEVASTLFSNPSTAHRLLKDFVKLKVGDVVIQNGATSAVGFYVIQMAKRKGIKTINLFKKGDSEEDTEATRQEILSLGATWAVTDDELADAENPITKKIKLYGVPKLGLTRFGGDAASTIIKKLESGGTLVSYGSMVGSQIPISAPDIHAVEFTMVNWVRKSSAQDISAMFHDIVEWFIFYDLKISPCTRVDFKDWEQAMGGFSLCLSSLENTPILFVL